MKKNNGEAVPKKPPAPVYTCPSCGNTKMFNLFFTGTMEALCDCSGGSIVTISEEFNNGGCIDKTVCNECGAEV